LVAIASSFDTFDRFDFFDLDISSSGVRLLKIQLITALQVWCAPCLIASGRSDVEDLGSWVIVARKHIAPLAVELNVRATGKNRAPGQHTSYRNADIAARPYNKRRRRSLWATGGVAG
jgi:hypothetical protein